MRLYTRHGEKVSQINHMEDVKVDSPVGRIISTDYSELFKFMFPHLRMEKRLPARDGFLLVKSLKMDEVRMLRSRYKNFIAVSGIGHEGIWGREEIVAFMQSRNRSRRKVVLGEMSDEDFVHHAKVFWVSGMWEHAQEDESMLDLFKHVLRPDALKYYYELRQSMPAGKIFYSLLTFVTRCLDPDVINSVSASYYRVIRSVSGIIGRNYRTALNHYSKYDDEIDMDFKTVRFILDLGNMQR